MRASPAILIASASELPRPDLVYLLFVLVAELVDLSVGPGCNLILLILDIDFDPCDLLLSQPPELVSVVSANRRTLLHPGNPGRLEYDVIRCGLPHQLL